MRRAAHPAAERIGVRRSRWVKVGQGFRRRPDPVAVIGLLVVVLFCVAFWAAVAWGVAELLG